MRASGRPRYVGGLLQRRASEFKLQPWAAARGILSREEPEQVDRCGGESGTATWLMTRRPTSRLSRPGSFSCIHVEERARVVLAGGTCTAHYVIQCRQGGTSDARPIDRLPLILILLFLVIEAPDAVFVFLRPSPRFRTLQFLFPLSSVQHPRRDTIAPSLSSTGQPYSDLTALQHPLGPKLTGLPPLHRARHRIESTS